MRLSSRLSDKSKNHGEIESFIDWEKYTTSPDEETEDIHLIAPGDFIEIQIGKITMPFYSQKCDDIVSFVSSKKLHCLIVNDKMISIDCHLECTDYDEDDPICSECDHCVQSWFLVEADDIFKPTPTVCVAKENFKLPEHIKFPVETENKFSEWLNKAEIAHKERLGAGAVIYLRSVLEQITIKVGHDAGVDIYKPNGKTKPFNQVLQAVDQQCSIIPVIYSDIRRTGGTGIICPWVVWEPKRWRASCRNVRIWKPFISARMRIKPATMRWIGCWITFLMASR